MNTLTTFLLRALRGLTCLCAVSALSAQTVSIVVDNDNAANGTSVFSYTPTGGTYWTLKTTADGQHGTSYLEDNTTTADTGLAARWRPRIATAGHYDIYVRHPSGANRPTSVPIEVNYEGGTRTDSSRRVNQTINAGKWVFLGRYYFTADPDQIATPANSVRILGTGVGKTAIDAVRFDLARDTATLPGFTPLNPALADFVPAQPVHLTRDDAGSFSLTVNGVPFYVKGVCSPYEIGTFAAAGANAMRTYAVNILRDPAVEQAILASGVKVMVGLNLPESSAATPFVTNPEMVDAAVIRAKREIDEFREKPYVLGWAIGNEIDELSAADPTFVYTVMQDIARYAHAVDPYHPTFCVLAASNPEKIRYVRLLAPDIDILVNNLYSQIVSAHQKITSDEIDPDTGMPFGGWKGAYLVGEFAINTPSQAGTKTSWGSIIEPLAQEKHDTYFSRYRDYIYANRGRCIGSFVFSSAQSYRVTHTWYNLLLETNFKTAPLDYRKTAAFDGMFKAWQLSPTDPTGIDAVDPADRAPKITTMYLDEKLASESVHLKKNTAVRTYVNVTDTDSQAMTYWFEIRRAGDFYDAYKAPLVTWSQFTPDSNNPRVAYFNTSLLTDGYGEYRIYGYAADSTGHVATANVPFLLDASGTPGVSFTTSPGDSTFAVGTQKVFGSALSNPNGLSVSYKWYRNDVEISGATASSYTIASVATTDSGQYYVTATTSGGTVASLAAKLTVFVPVAITTQPVSVNAITGGRARFAVSTVGSSALTYQWRKNGVTLTEAQAGGPTIGPVLVLENVTSDSAGNYSVVVSNGFSRSGVDYNYSVTSNAGALAVTSSDVAPPALISLTAAPTDVLASHGRMAPVTLTASVFDDAAAAVTLRVTGVTCNESTDANDWSFTGTAGDLTVWLRAIDLPQTPTDLRRSYFITVEARDGVNLTATKTIEVKVTSTHDMLAPAADTYVRDGTSAGVNYGGAAVLAVRLQPTANDNRMTYLKFDLSAYQSKPTQAVLLLVPTTVSNLGAAPSAAQAIALTSNDGWAESTLTWNTRGSYGADYGAFATWSVPPIGGAAPPIAIDVTDQVRNAVDWDKTVSFRVFATSDLGYVEYGSGEAATNLQPVLLIKR